MRSTPKFFYKGELETPTSGAGSCLEVQSCDRGQQTELLGRTILKIKGRKWTQDRLRKCILYCTTILATIWGEVPQDGSAPSHTPRCSRATRRPGLLRAEPTQGSPAHLQHKVKANAAPKPTKGLVLKKAVVIHTARSSCVTWNLASPSGRKGPPTRRATTDARGSGEGFNLVEGGRPEAEGKPSAAPACGGPSGQPCRPAQLTSSAPTATEEGEPRRKRPHERTRASPQVKSSLPPCQCQCQPGPPPVPSATPGAHRVPGAREVRTRRRGPGRAIRRLTSTPPPPGHGVFREISP